MPFPPLSGTELKNLDENNAPVYTPFTPPPPPPPNVRPWPSMLFTSTLRVSLNISGLAGSCTCSEPNK